MPVRRLFYACLALALISACDSVVEDGAVSTTATPAAATGFVTANTAPPPGASDSRGDGVMRDADGRPFGYALLGAPLPAFKGTLSDGKSFDSASLTKWTVIDIWGIWCSDCVADAPYADALARAVAQDPELAFLSVHVPASAARTTPDEMFGKYGSVDAYMREKGYSYPVVVDTTAALRETLKVSWTPTYLLVSPDGIVRGFRTDLSVSSGEPVKDFMRDIARVRSEVKKAALEVAVPATIGPGGAMNLKGATAFKLDAMKFAFPAHDIVSETVAGGVSNYPVFHIETTGSGARERLYTVEPDWSNGFVQKVRTWSPAVSGPRGERIGTTGLADWLKQTGASCTRDVPDAPEIVRVGCRIGTETAEYVFAAPAKSVTGPYSSGTPRFKTDPVLYEMRYMPPVPARKN